MRTNTVHTRAARAFTLLEVLMSAFVLALGSLGLLALFAGAATQQQASAQLTDSVTLSKNAEAQLRAAFEGFATDAQLGCNAPFFEPDAWYCLFADQRFGFLTVNPSDDPTSDALYFEADPRSGQTPITLYSATTDAANRLILGIGSLQNAAIPPYSYGSPPLTFDLGDRRLLLRASNGDDLRVRISYREIIGDPSTQTISLVNSLTSPVDYRFTGTCSDAQTNQVYLTQSGAPPTSDTQDHVRINTQTIPVDGTQNARLVGFRIDEIEKPDKQVCVRVNVGTGEPLSPIVAGPQEFEVRPDYEPVSWIDPAFGGGGSDVWVAPAAAPAEFTALPNDPRVGPYTHLTNLPVTDPTQLTTANNMSVGFVPGTIVPAGADVPVGPFVIAGDLPSGTRYTTTDPLDGSMPVGRVRGLFYAPRVITEITIDYKRRADELISLNDRLNFIPDPKFVGGRRPDMGYSVLYRDRAGRGSDQFVVFTYTLAPSRNDAQWFPPETANDVESGRAPLRMIEGAELFYEAGEDRYFLVVQADDSWVAQRGSLLLFAGAPVAGTTKGPGAETVVRVAQILEYADGRRGLVLDAPPRSAGETLLSIFYGSATSGAFDVWAVQDRVTSRADDSEWILHPIEARVFQAGE